jgi:hypothetical protein
LNDFSLATSGVPGATVTGVSGSGNVYTVTVSSGNGNESIRLDLPASDTLTDLAGNSLANLPYTSGDTYTISKVFTLIPATGLPLKFHLPVRGEKKPRKKRRTGS